MKTTWNIIRKETNKLTNKDNITSLRIKDQVIHNKITIANELNNYFLNIAGSVSNKMGKEKRQVPYKIYLNALTSHLNT